MDIDCGFCSGIKPQIQSIVAGIHSRLTCTIGDCAAFQEISPKIGWLAVRNILKID
jgi:hypothetical protein